MYDFIFRILTTPKEETWPGITQLPDFKPMFPNWTNFALRTVVKDLDDKGLDLLEVSCFYKT